MALTPSEFVKADYARRYAWYIGERGEGEYGVEEYELDGIHYDLYYEWRYGTWTTPAGEVRPCTQQTRVLTALKQRPCGSPLPT